MLRKINSEYPEATSDKPIPLDFPNKILDIFQSILLKADISKNLDSITCYELLLMADKSPISTIKYDIELLLKAKFPVVDEERFENILNWAQQANSSVLLDMCAQYLFREIQGDSNWNQVSIWKESDASKCLIEIECAAFSEAAKNLSPEEQRALLIKKTQILKIQLPKLGVSNGIFNLSGYIIPELVMTVFHECKSMISGVIFRPVNELKPRCYFALGSLNSLKKLTFSIPSPTGLDAFDSTTYAKYLFSHENLTDKVIETILLKLLSLEYLSFDTCNFISDTGIILLALNLTKLKKLEISNCTNVTFKNLEEIKKNL